MGVTRAANADAVTGADAANADSRGGGNPVLLRKSAMQTKQSGRLRSAINGLLHMGKENSVVSQIGAVNWPWCDFFQ
jgi:hypothetical protein